MADTLIERVGHALWGNTWMACLADELQVRRDSIQDWKQGRRSPAPAQWRQLNVLIRKRRVLLTALANETEPRRS